MASRRKRGRHARPSRAGTITGAVTGAGFAAGVLAAVMSAASSAPAVAQPSGTFSHFPPRVRLLAQGAPPVVRGSTYIVQPGQYLSLIAALECGSPADWTGIAQASGLADPDDIYAGEKLRLDCARQALRAVSQPAPPSSGALSGTLDCSQLEALWDSAGGSPAAAFTAAEVAMAESGGRQYATGTVGEESYWQINPVNDGMIAGGQVIEASYDPMTNARDAVALSQDGTTWSDWTTFTSGEYAGQC